MKLSVLYRGPLASCNYQCHYCPFAKRTETKAQLKRDRESLERFTAWISSQTQHQWRVLFTPWGEALVRRWYRDAITALSYLGHVESVAAQTNLSCSVDWMADCCPKCLALWTTYHPSEADPATFVRKVRRLQEWGVRLSVGMVAVPDRLEPIVAMRQILPSDVYLWINPQQPRSRRYTPEEIALLGAIDPQFKLAVRRQRSLGRRCLAGEVSFTVDGFGNMRRCHFVDEIIGSIDDLNWEQALQPRICPNHYCDCFLGRAQLNAGPLSGFFGSSLLERIASIPDHASSVCH